MGSARAEGPGQGGMANSGGRLMLRTDRQELMYVCKALCNGLQPYGDLSPFDHFGCHGNQLDFANDKLV